LGVKTVVGALLV